MPCPLVLQELYIASTDVYESFIQGYDALVDRRIRRGTDQEEMRRDLIKDFLRLEAVCYTNYFSPLSRHIPPVPPQDDWLHILQSIRTNIALFTDSRSLHQVLDTWERAHTRYRAWVTTSGFSQQSLSSLWHELEDDEDDD